MPVERNEPCPCGSGKKYKKCCGQTGEISGPEAYRVNRAIAYAGRIGNLRLDFCNDYRLFKEKVTGEIVKKQLAATASNGEKISCIPGCIDCCKTYVFASLEEAECIVHFLYRHDDILEHFLAEYSEKWRPNPVVGHLLPKLNYYQGLAVNKSLSQMEESQFDKCLGEFYNQNLRCPFLAGNDTCTIYEVRPFACSGVVSTTPVDWCAANSPNYAKVKLCRVEMKPASNMPYFLKDEDLIIFGCLQDIVHNLLARGYGYLEGALNRPGLRQEVMSDRDVAKILTKSRISMPG